MKKIIPIHKAVEFATKQSMRLADKTLEKKEIMGGIFTNLANFTLFVNRTFRETFSREFEVKEFLRQCFHMGNKSLPLIALTGFILGLVLTIQSRPMLIDFGAITMLPGMVAVSIIREMGPVITALICAGKIGSGIGAELGSMRVTEQIDAMEVSATNPFRYLIVTRVIAATLMIPLLVLFADAMGILGSWIGANLKGDVSFTLYYHQAFSKVDFGDFIPALIKTFFFGAVIGLVGCYKGYHAGRGTESVGIAANASVVVSSLLVIIVDLVAVQITDMI